MKYPIDDIAELGLYPDDNINEKFPDAAEYEELPKGFKIVIVYEWIEQDAEEEKEPVG